jgi:pilus assembly protein Flp/PilA
MGERLLIKLSVASNSIVKDFKSKGAWIMFSFLSNNKEEGQGLVEYALILVLVAVVSIVALALVGPAVSDVYCDLIVEFGMECDSGGEDEVAEEEPPARIEGDAARTQYCAERPGWVGGVNWGFAGGHEWTTDGQTYYVTGEPFNCPYP